jgi:hypothetical protein
VNISHDGGPIIAFTSDWCARNEPQDASRSRSDREWIAYCRARQLAESDAAEHASSTRARRIHEELARAYGRMIERATRA